MDWMRTVTVVRRDPPTGLFVQVPPQVRVDIQDAPDEAPQTTSEPFLVEGGTYTRHTLIAATWPLPDIRRGDGLVDPGDIDPGTLLPMTYDVLAVRRWQGDHLEVAARRPVTPADMAAINGRELLAYHQTAWWLQRILPDDGGAVPTPAWDDARAQTISFSDGSYGKGWATADGHRGYRAPAQVTVGVNDAARVEQWQEGGLVLFEGAIVLYQRPVVLTREDVLVLADGRRFAVGDEITPIQVYGQTVLERARLEIRDPADPIYSISVPAVP